MASEQQVQPHYLNAWDEQSRAQPLAYRSVEQKLKQYYIILHHEVPVSLSHASEISPNYTSVYIFNSNSSVKISISY